MSPRGGRRLNKLSAKALPDILIGWQDAPSGTRPHLLKACCAGIRLRTLASNSLALAICAGLIIAETHSRVHVAWLVAVILGGLLPRVYAAHLRRQNAFDIATERKAWHFIALSGLYGVLWGLGPFLILPHIEGTSVGVLLFIMVFGTIMGPYAAIPGILYIRFATTGTATLVAVALHTPPPVALVCFVAGIWLVLRMDVWRSYHRTLRQQFELQEALEQRQAELQWANRMLQEMAETDPLTGAANRRQFLRHLATLKGPAALVLLDIDHFKSVNDAYGHQVGDTVLVELAALIQGVLRPGDLLARIGGEEFAIVLSGRDVAGATGVAERIRDRVAKHEVCVDQRRFHITVSLGIAAVPPGVAAEQMTDLLREADAALYAAKHQGRNRILMFDQAANGPVAVRPAQSESSAS